MRAEVIIREGEVPVGRYLIEPGEYMIGRDTTCQIRVNRNDVSRQHARLVYSGRGCEIEDLGSKSGTAMGGRLVEGIRQFQPPCEITIGGAVLAIHALPENDTVAQPVAQPESTASLEAVREALQGERYDVGYMLNRGAMGAIHSARDLNLGRTVALKVILDDRNAARGTVMRFLREARVLAMLDHPNIVPVHELAVNAEGRIYYAMKFVKGVERVEGAQPGHRRQVPAGAAAEHFPQGLRRDPFRALAEDHPPRPQAGQHHARRIR
jgi:hypothetical protein